MLTETAISDSCNVTLPFESVDEILKWDHSK